MKKTTYPESWKRVLAMLSDKQQHRVSEIAEYLSKSVKATSNQLRRMHAEGLITTAHHGWYALDPEGAYTLPQAKDTVRAGVYLLRYQELYKIGKSINVPARVEQIRSAVPFDVQHVHTIAAADPSPLEKHLHERFADKRVRGEWFALDVLDVDELCEM
jgi:hypothetical protein